MSMPDREDRDNDQPQGGQATAVAEAPEAPATQETRRPSARRDDANSDVALDAAHLKLDELTLELQASVGVERLNVAAKGLDAELYLRANLENLVALVDTAASRTPGIIEGVARSRGDRGADREQSQLAHGGPGLNKELESALEGARSAYERVSGSELREELQEAYQTVRSAYERVVGDASGDEQRRDGGGGGGGEGGQGGDAPQQHDATRSSSPTDTARRFVRSPGGAATAAVAGAAVGALANAKSGSHDGLRQMLPGRRRSAVSGLAERASELPGEVATAVRRRMP